MSPPLTTESVANWFIIKATESGERLTAMKLQKTIYYAHGWCLALYKVPLVTEYVQARIFGPIFPSIYDLSKKYGSNPIDSLLYEYASTPSLIQDSDPRIPLLERIWEVYGKYSATHLSMMVNEIDGPLSITLKNNLGRRGMNIPEDLLTEYFISLIDK